LWGEDSRLNCGCMRKGWRFARSEKSKAAVLKHVVAIWEDGAGTCSLRVRQRKCQPKLDGGVGGPPKTVGVIPTKQKTYGYYSRGCKSKEERNLQLPQSQEWTRTLHQDGFDQGI